MSAGLAVRSGNTVACSCKKDIREMAGCFLTPPITLHLRSSIKPRYCFLSLAFFLLVCLRYKKITRDNDEYPVLPISQILGRLSSVFMGRGSSCWTELLSSLHGIHVILTLLHKLTCLTESLIKVRKKCSDE